MTGFTIVFNQATLLQYKRSRMNQISPMLLQLRIISEFIFGNTIQSWSPHHSINKPFLQ